MEDLLGFEVLIRAFRVLTSYLLEFVIDLGALR